MAIGSPGVAYAESPGCTLLSAVVVRSPELVGPRCSSSSSPSPPRATRANTCIRPNPYRSKGSGPQCLRPHWKDRKLAAPPPPPPDPPLASLHPSGQLPTVAGGPAHPQPRRGAAAPSPDSWSLPLPSLPSTSSQLSVTALVVALSTFVLVRTFHPRYRNRQPQPSSARASQGSKKRQQAVDKILRAQTAASSSSAGADEHGKSAGGGFGTRSRANSTLAVAAELLPSGASVASASAAVLSGLERLSSAASEALKGVGSSGGRAGAGTEAKQSEEDANEAAEEKDKMGEGSATGVVGSSLSISDGTQRRRGGKKGKGTAWGGAGGAGGKGGLAAVDSAASSASSSRSPARRPSLKESGTSMQRPTMVEMAVQTSPRLYGRRGSRGFEEEEARRTPPPPLHLDSETVAQTPTPKHHSPVKEKSESSQVEPLVEPTPAEPQPLLPDPEPPSAMLEPHQVPLPDSPSPSAPPALPAPAPRPPVLPLPFDLHASFQSTPPSLPPVPSSSSSTSSSYALPSSPPLSPTPSRSPSTSSGSPTSRRPSSPTLTLDRRPSVASTSSLSTTSASSSNMLAPASGAASASASPSPSHSRQRKQARKQSVASSNAAIPGMPRASSVSASGSSASTPVPASSATMGGAGGEEGGGLRPHNSRRLSTASSTGSAGEGGRGGPSILMTPSDGGGAGAFSRRASVVSNGGGAGFGRRSVGPGKGKGREQVLAAEEERDWGAREGRLKGLGVDMDDDAVSVDGGTGGGSSVRGSSPNPSASGRANLEGYFAGQPAAFSSGRGSGPYAHSLTSPETSPHPQYRSLAALGMPPSTGGGGGNGGTTLATPTSQRPWSPQIMAREYTMIPYPVSSSTSSSSTAPTTLSSSTSSSIPPPSQASHPSRPPSRGSSLSVPPNLSQSQQQQLQLAQQQQQQQQAAYAQYAQAHAQYQQAYAMQLAQAQVQAQQQQAQQQREQQHQHRLDRSRRRTMTGDESDGLLSPATANGGGANTPNGLVYPLSSSVGANGVPNGTSWSASHPASPLAATFNHQHLTAQQPQQQQQLVALSQGVSPTTASFPSNVQQYPSSSAAAAAAVAAQAQAQAIAANNAALINAAAAAGMFPSAYLQSPVAVNGPSAVHQGQPPRPRLSSSVSSIAALGGGDGKSGKNGAAPSPTSAKTPSSSKGRGSLSASVPASLGGGGANAIQLDSPAGFKAKLKNAEVDVNRMEKELEIARWKLVTLEEDKNAAEIEHNEALRALAARAMRAEARIKYLEESRAAAASSSSSVSPYETASTSAPAAPPSSNGAATPSPGPSPAMAPAALPNTCAEVVTSPDKTVHPLAWVELDSISFSSPRPLNPPRPPAFHGSPSPHGGGGNNRRKGNRNSWGNGNSGFDAHPGMGRRRSTTNSRRKSGNPPPYLAAAATPAPVEDDHPLNSSDDEVVIVLDAPVRRAPRPQRIPASRRSSYLADDDAPLDPDGSTSFLDDDELPSIDIDESEPIAGGIVEGQNDDGEKLHAGWVGFLPSYLSPGRSSSSTSGGSPRWTPDQQHSDGSVPSLILDAPRTEEPLDEADEDAAVRLGEASSVPLPRSAATSDDEQEQDERSEEESVGADDGTNGHAEEESQNEEEDPVVQLPLPFPVKTTPLSPISDASERTPRVKPPPSPPSPISSFSPPKSTSTSSGSKTASPISRRSSFGSPKTVIAPEDVPLPPSSPLVHTSA
ncbi:hypothetical protein JCM8547_004031 [Rhodosporidiobolus lusitaniae]